MMTCIFHEMRAYLTHGFLLICSEQIQIQLMSYDDQQTKVQSWLIREKKNSTRPLCCIWVAFTCLIIMSMGILDRIGSQHILLIVKRRLNSLLKTRCRSQAEIVQPATVTYPIYRSPTLKLQLKMVYYSFLLKFFLTQNVFSINVF